MTAENFDSFREIAAAVLGILMTGGLPFLISYIKMQQWSVRTKSLVALLMCIATGALTVLVHGNITGGNLTEVILAIYTASNLIYNQFLKGTSLDARLEQKTAFRRVKQYPVDDASGATRTRQK